MASFLLRVGSLDISDYVRADQEVTPYDPDALEPSFTDSPIREGGRLSQINVGLEERVWPLFLSAPDPQAAHNLQQSVNRELAKAPGITSEWRMTGVTRSTFYDVEAGRFEPAFNLRHTQSGWQAGVLRLWTQPYGHTNAARIAATAAGTGNHFLQVAGPSMIGDVDARLYAELKTDASVLTTEVALSVLPHPSYAAQIPAASLTNRQAGATLADNAAAALGKVIIAPGARGASYVEVCRAPLAIPSTFLGRNRVIAHMANLYNRPLYVHGQDPLSGALLSPAQTIPQSGDFSPVDLGVLTIQDPVPAEQQVAIVVTTGASSGFSASPAVYVNDVVLLPEDRTAVFSDSAAGTGPRAWHLDGISERPWRAASSGALQKHLARDQVGAIPRLEAGAPIAALAMQVGANRTTADVLSATIKVKERVRFAF